jgi:GntR family transcriptional regulator/MocR family aminotransferase
MQRAKISPMMRWLAFAIDGQNGSLYTRVYRELRRAILDGRLKPAARLPPSRQLAQELSVSRNTVLGAYQQLFAEGYIEAADRAGTFVARTLPEEMLQPRMTTGQIAHQRCQRRSLSRRGRELVQASPDDNFFAKPRPFRCATPDYPSFPFEIWSRLLGKYSRHPSADLLGYHYPAGHPRLRRAVADYLKLARAVRCKPEQVIIVPGTQIALDLVSQVLLDSGEIALIEDPGYFGVRGAFMRAGLQIGGVPVDPEGISIEYIRRKGRHARLVYVTPSYQFPLGITMSLARRLELLDWAAKAKAWIFEDDCAGEYRYNGRPTPSLQGLDNNDRVIYVGSFSKLLFPSLRVSYLVSPPDLVESFIKARVMTDLHSATVPQAALADFLEEGHFARHLRRMRALYSKRQSYFLAAAKAELAGLLEIENRGAGMHLIGWLPSSVDDRAAARAASDHEVATAPLSAFRFKRRLLGGLVLGYTAFTERQIRDGVRNLKVALSSL